MQSRIFNYTFAPLINVTVYLKSRVIKVCVDVTYFGLTTIQAYLGGKTALFNFNNQLKKIELEAKRSSNKFAAQPIGFTSEHYAYLIPTSSTQLEQIIDYADQKPQGRDGYKMFNHFAPMNILSNTHSRAVKDHKDLLASLSLNTGRYLKELSLLCEEMLPHHSYKFGAPTNRIEKMLHRLFAKMMFDFDLNDSQINIIKRASEYGLNNTGNPFSTITSFFSSQFHQIDHEYQDMMNALLQSQVKKIKSWLKLYKDTRTEKNNYLLKKIVDLIKESNPQLSKIDLIQHINNIKDKELISYLKHNKIMQLPLILAGLSNLISLSNFVVDRLHKTVDSGLLNELSDHILHDNTDILGLKKLHFLCLQGLNESTTPYIVRYFSEKTIFGDVEIPINTTVFISLKSEEAHISPDISIPRKYPFSPFSIGERACPAMAIVLPIVKYLSLHLAKQSQNVVSEILFKIIDQGNNTLLNDYCEMKIDLNGQDKIGDTILHRAIRIDNVKAVDILVRKGIDLTIKNKSGRSPLELAKYFNRKLCTDLLEQSHGSKYKPS